MTTERADVVVVGAGPAGIAAACCAAENSARVLLVDDNPNAGGQIWRGRTKDGEARGWLQRLMRSGAELRFSTRVLGVVDQGVLLSEREGEAVFLHDSKLILATGARELFLPFPGWTLPGVFGAGGLQALVEGGLPIRGKRVMVAGSGPLLLAVAMHLKQQGARVEAIAEQASWGAAMRFAACLPAKKLVQGAELLWQLKGTPMLHSAWPVGAEGKGALQRVHMHTSGGTRSFDCDYLACGFGLTPNTELAQLFGCGLKEDGFVAVDSMQRTTVPGIYCAGEPTGIGGLESSLVEGQIAGLAAAGVEVDGELLRLRDRGREFATGLARAFALRAELRGLCRPDTMICRCEDVRFGQLQPYGDWKSLKLQTRCGMGPCQARICGPAIRFLTESRIRPESVRAPVYAAAMKTLAAADEDGE